MTRRAALVACLLAGLGIATVGATSAHALTISLPLQELIGDYGPDELDFKVSSFDAGVPLSQVQRADLVVSGVGQCSQGGCSVATMFDVYFGFRLIHPPTLLPPSAQLGPFPSAFSVTAPVTLPPSAGTTAQLFLVPSGGIGGSVSSAQLVLVPEAGAPLLLWVSLVLAPTAHRRLTRRCSGPPAASANRTRVVS